MSSIERGRSYTDIITGNSTNESSASVLSNVRFDKHNMYQVQAQVTIEYDNQNGESAMGYYTISGACRNNNFIGKNGGYRLDTISHDLDCKINELNITCGFYNEQLYVKYVHDDDGIFSNVKLMCNLQITQF